MSEDMDPLTLLALSLLGGLGVAAYEDKDDNKLDPTEDVLEKLKDATKIPVPPLERWVEVESSDGKWLVSPLYIGPVGIGEAQKIARINNAQLPSPALVDAIYNAADLKIEPHPRGPYSHPPSDFTAKTMNSVETNIAQLAFIKGQIDEKSPNWDFKLLTGTHKDVVKDPATNKLALYGWRKVSDGKNLQPLFGGHSEDWKDYSQGVRLVKRIA